MKAASAASYYREGSERAKHVRRLFSKIARNYDLINDLQSAGMHRIWKRRLVSMLQLRPAGRVLDVACGSGDLVFRILHHQPQAHVMGGDYTLPMLKVAQRRADHERSSPQGWVHLDALSLPFKSGSFDAVTIAYGLRNMADPLAALSEMARVLKTGGEIAILDFGKPPNRGVRLFYYFFLRTIQPMLGWLFFRDAETYRYIYESLMRYPAQEGVVRLLREAGFAEVVCLNLGWGTMSLHRALKKDFPSNAASMSAGGSP